MEMKLLTHKECGSTKGILLRRVIVPMKKEGMSDYEYEVYTFGFGVALHQYNNCVELILHKIEI